MQKNKRIAALVLAAAMLTVLFCGCTSAKTKQEQTVIGSCAGFDVLYEELRYVTLTYKDLFAATYGEDIWDTPESAEKYRAELEETVWSMMLSNYAVLATCLAHGMTEDSMKDDDIEAAVEEQIQEVITQYGGEKAFRQALDEMYMTEHFLRFVLRVAQLENELFYILTDDLGLIETETDAFLDWMENGNSVYVQHIYIENDPGEDREENRAIAEDIRRQLLDGADIADFVGKKVNEDMENTSPYFLVRDVYAEEMENAAFALQNVGDVSEVIDTGDGYYVMVRMDYGEATLLIKAAELLNSYQWARVEAIVEEHQTKLGLKIELNEYGKSLDLLAIE